MDIADEPASVGGVSQAENPFGIETIAASTRFAQLIIQLSDRLNQRVAEIFATSEGLKAVEVRILLSLAREQPRGVGHISRRTRLDKAWISRTLRSLEDKGMVRIEDEEATRAKLVSLTPAGMDAATRIIPLLTEEWARLARGIDARLAVDMLTTMLGNIENS